MPAAPAETALQRGLAALTIYREIAAGTIFLVAMVAIITRPRGLNESLSASVGAGAMLVFGVLGAGPAAATLVSEWNLFLFFAGLMLISGLADAAGFFDAAGALAVAVAGGSGRRLLLAVFAAGALITTFLSNDATALILTPVVYAVATRLRLPPLPYLFATTFVADTASMTLPVSNPINILVSDRLHIGLGAYAGHLLLASLAVIALNAAIFQLVFRRQLGGGYRADWRLMLGEAVPDRRLFRLTCGGLAVTGAAYVVGSALRLPLGPVALGGAALLMGLALVAGNLRPDRVRHHVSLTLFIYVAGLLLLVRGVEEAGLTGAVVGWLTGQAGDPLRAVGAGLAGGAIGANLVNNVPATLVLLSGSGSGHLAPGLGVPFLLGGLAGADLGPNLTPVGSLSTMLWLIIVRRHGVEVSTLDYLKLGAAVTPLLLLTAGLLIAATFWR
ncbi:MAG: arsenic transporter [Candidatus Nephthysia bennettiae]|nr:MAG: arsenic transporter [Candidatus Dormibacteraeota bacterium]